MPEIKNPHDTAEQIVARKDQKDPWVMYLIVRESLKMSSGKIAAQVGHGVGMIYGHVFYVDGKAQEPVRDELILAFNSWVDESYRKVVLKADDKEFEKIKMEHDCFIVRDAGLTEVAPNSETVIALFPMKKSQALKTLKRLQVLK